MARGNEKDIIMPKSVNYYYDQLNKDQQRAYYAMKQGLLNLQDSFAVPMLSKKELSGTCA